MSLGIYPVGIIGGGASTASATEVFAAYFQCANELGHKPPHKYNRDYVLDTAIAFPELGRTPADVRNSPAMQTMLEALKVQSLL